MKLSANKTKEFSLAAAPPNFIQNPFPFYEGFLKYEPVLAQPDGSFIISKHKHLDMIYRDTKRFSSDKKTTFEPIYGKDSPLFEHHTTSLVFNDPPLHTRVRKAMVGALNARAISAMESGLIKSIDLILDRLSNTDTIDLIDDFASQIPIQVIGNLFDIPMQDRKPLRDWSLAILGALEPRLNDKQKQQGNQAVTEFLDFLRILVAERKRSPGNPETDVLSRLILSEGTEISEIELLQNCIFILNAGHETTTNLIGNALASLQNFPDEKAALINDPNLIATAVDEFLRYLSPNQFGNRITTEDVKIGGVDISKGSNLHLCIGSANRDPDVFYRPNLLDITRHPNPHLAFAGGPHLCVGFSLARMEGRVAITRFLNRFSDYKILPEAVQGGRIRFRGFSALPAQLGNK